MTGMHPPGEGGPPPLDRVSFQGAFESLPDPMVVVDAAGQIVAVNALAEALLGYERGELVGERVEVLVPDERRDGHAVHRGTYLTHPTARPMGRGLDLAARRRDGTTIPVDISLSPLHLDGDRVVLVALRDMTTQRETEEALAAFAFIVQTSDDAIYQVDPRGRIQSWNPAAARMTGFTEREALGEAPDFLFPAHLRAEEAEVLRRALKGERIERRETELERRHKLLVPVELTVSPLRDRAGRIVGASVIAHDITEQRLAQDYLAESQSRLQEAQELASVGMWSWDRSSGAVQYSEPLYRILDVDPDTFDGTFDEFVGCIAPDDRHRVGAVLRAAGEAGEPVTLECEITRREAGAGWVSIRAEVVRNSGGDVVGLRGIVQDLTERHRAETAVHDALILEREAAEKLRAADQLKDEFLSTVSHELRTPLTAIVGLSSVLVARPTLDDTAPDLIARIKRNAEEMNGMVERLLDFSRLEAGRVVLHPMDLQVVAAAAKSLEQAEAALVEHEVDLDVDPDVLAHADPDAFARVMVNLLTNAAKFSPPGSTIHVGAREDEDEVIVCVRDEGNGLDRSAAARVFERFFQVEADQRPGKRGTGVGLAIVQRYVEMHGGRVWLDSELGAGTTFSFSLPRAVGTRL